MQTEEQVILERIKVARGTSEPAEVAPTDETQVVNVSDDEAPDEAIKVEAEQAETAKAETETTETEELEGQETTHDDVEELYVELDGREISLSDIKEWEQGNLRQSDYTRRTQELADIRREYEAKESDLMNRQKTLDDKLALIEVMIEEDVLSEDNLLLLREDDPDEYIKHTEKQAKRKTLLADKRSVVPGVDRKKEAQGLWADNPSWLNDKGEITEAHKNDTALLQGFLNDNGYVDDDMNRLTTRDYQTMLDAAKYRSSNKKSTAMEKKIRKAPTMTKPRATANAGLETKLQAAKEKAKRTGDLEDGMAVRRLQNQIRKSN